MSARTVPPAHRADPDPQLAYCIMAGFAVVLVALLVGIWSMGVTR